MGEERFGVGGGVREPRGSAGEGEVYKQSTILELQQKCRFTTSLNFAFVVWTNNCKVIS